MRTLLFFALATSACHPWMRFDDDDGSLVEEVRDVSPELDLTIDREDGVLGPTDAIVIEVFDPDDMSLSVTLDFTDKVHQNIESGGTVVATGEMLGEGYGDLYVRVADADGFTDTYVADLLVDLTPPRAELSPCVLAASGEGDRGAFSAWVGDAWVLGSVELAVNGEPFARESFPEFPATFLEAWDWSYFSFPATELPVGASVATLTVRDRAGNVTSASCDLFVDGLAPSVVLSASVDDEVIAATVTATDDDPEFAPLLVLYAGHAEVAHGQGPATTFTLDRGDFPSGALVLVGAARDRAGNEGASTPLVLEL